jgi:xanthine phosphoribosyltransferase
MVLREESTMSAHSKYNKTYPISWDQLHRDSKALAWRLLNTAKFKGMIAITRGGMERQKERSEYFENI